MLKDFRFEIPGNDERPFTISIGNLKKICHALILAQAKAFAVDEQVEIVISMQFDQVTVSLKKAGRLYLPK